MAIPDGAVNLFKNPALYSFQPEEMTKVHKIVVTRDIGEKAMAILEQVRPDFKSYVCYVLLK
jgi:hypothetical protein